MWGDPPDRRLYKDLGGPAKGYPMSGLVPSYMDKEVSYKIGGNIPGRQQRKPTDGNRNGVGGAGTDASHCRPGADVVVPTVKLAVL